MGAEVRAVNYYERHIGDYIRDTSHLSLLEHGAYTRLLDIYYARESGIPDDQAERLVCARTEEERAAVRAVLKEFFTLDGKVWRHARCDAEIAAHHEYIAKQSRNGKKSAEARRLSRKRKTVGQRYDTGSTAVEQEHNSGSTVVEPELNSGSTVVEPVLNGGSTVVEPVLPSGCVLVGTPNTHYPNNYSVRPNPADSASLDAALFAEARKVFGASIGGQINRAIRRKGKSWVLGMIEACRGKDPEAARAYLAAALKEPERKVVV